MTITTSSESNCVHTDDTAECIISSANDDDAATLYFRCFGAVIDAITDTPAAVVVCASSGEPDADHSNHTDHRRHHPSDEQCLPHSHYAHPQFAHHHPHLQTSSRNGSNSHHLWRTRTPASGNTTPHIIVDDCHRATCTINETSDVNSRFSDSLEMETPTAAADESDCDRLNSLFQQIRPTTTTTRTRCRVVSGALSVTSWWLTVLAICAASMQPAMAGKDGKTVWCV